MKKHKTTDQGLLFKSHPNDQVFYVNLTYKTWKVNVSVAFQI